MTLDIIYGTHSDLDPRLKPRPEQAQRKKNSIASILSLTRSRRQVIFHITFMMPLLIVRARDLWSDINSN